MGSRQFMIREIQSGRVVEKICFPVAPNVKPRNVRRRGNTLPRKQDANERACTKRLARLLNSNFEAGDLLLSPSIPGRGAGKAVCGCKGLGCAAPAGETRAGLFYSA